MKNVIASANENRTSPAVTGNGQPTTLIPNLGDKGTRGEFVGLIVQSPFPSIVGIPPFNTGLEGWQREIELSRGMITVDDDGHVILHHNTVQCPERPYELIARFPTRQDADAMLVRVGYMAEDNDYYLHRTIYVP
jgi:hypothetical protein